MLSVISSTKKYKVHNLVYYEVLDDIKNAIEREKQMKKWNRTWKLKLIEKDNPDWQDLYSELINKIDSTSTEINDSSRHTIESISASCNNVINNADKVMKEQN